MTFGYGMFCLWLHHLFANVSITTPVAKDEGLCPSKDLQWNEVNVQDEKVVKFEPIDTVHSPHGLVQLPILPPRLV